MLSIAPGESAAHQFGQSPAHQRWQPDRRCPYLEETIPTNGFFTDLLTFATPDVLVEENVEVAPGNFQDIQLNLNELASGVARGHFVILYRSEGAFRTTQDRWISSNSIIRFRGHSQTVDFEDSYAPATPGYRGQRMTGGHLSTEAAAEAICFFFQFTHDGLGQVIHGWVEEDDLLSGNNWVPRVVAAANGTPNPQFKLYRLDPGIGAILTEIPPPNQDKAPTFDENPSQDGVPVGFQRVICQVGIRNNHQHFWWRLVANGTFNGVPTTSNMFPIGSAQLPGEVVSPPIFELLISQAAYFGNVDQRSTICHPRGQAILALVDENADPVKDFEYNFNPIYQLTGTSFDGTFNLPGDVVRSWWQVFLHDDGDIQPITNATLDVDIGGSLNVKTVRWQDTPAPHQHRNTFVNYEITPDFGNRTVGIEKNVPGPATVKLRIWQNAVFQNVSFTIP